MTNLFSRSWSVVDEPCKERKQDFEIAIVEGLDLGAW